MSPRLKVMRARAPIAVAALLAVLGMACGQLPGVHRRVAARGGAEGFFVDEQVAGTEGQAGTQTSGATAGEGGAAGGGAGGAGGAGGGGGGAGGAGGGPGGPADRTGVSDTAITIGVHAPLTGAAPVESEAFQIGKDLFWKWLHSDLGKKVHGREVRVIFRDDQYSPSTAVAVCKQMAEQGNAFLLVGGAGTDQIQACAQYAQRSGIPYVSAGVTEVGLGNLGSYFALSATYRQQGPILAQLIYKSGKLGNVDQYSPNNVPQGDGDVKVALVRPDTPNFRDTEEGFRAGLKALGQDIDYVATVPKEGSSNLSAVIAEHVRQMRNRGIDVVATVAAPVITIELVTQAEGQAYRPRYVGPGITNGLNQVSNLLCGNKGANAGFHGASFLSPWPGWPEVMQGQYDADFAKAANKYAGDSNSISAGGDIILAFWGLSRNVHLMLEKAGRDLSRQSFIRMLDAGYRHETKVFPPIAYSPGKHFGVQQVHRLEADCTGDRAFHQREAFVSGY